MAEKKSTSTPTPYIRHSEDGRFVEYGFEQDGVSHPIGRELSGDFNERVQAAKEQDGE